MFNKKKFIFITAAFWYFLMHVSYSQWYEVTNLPETWNTWVLDAFDSLTATGPSNINHLFITTDGGFNWNSVTRPSYIDDISIIGENKIWICNSNGEIWATKNGGDSWELQFYNQQQTEFMNYIEFFDSLSGVAMGDAPTNNKPALFLRTTDGGQNWQSMNDTCLIGLWSGDLWRCVDFVNINIGYFYSYMEMPRKLYRTTDGGSTWKKIGESMGCHTLKFYDENIGIVKGESCPDSVCHPQIYRTIDGGDTWELVSTDSIGWGMDIEFIPGNPTDVWMIAGNRGYFSSDTGKTWIEQFYLPDFHTDSGFLDIVFADSEKGWLVGREKSPSLKPHLYYTKNGGFGGIVSIKEEHLLPPNYYLYQNYPNPFNPHTRIKFRIAEMQFVTLKVYDVLGKEIFILINEEIDAGEHEIDLEANGLSSGVYFYQLQAGDFLITKKLILLK
ncbi:MAG TPA: T9SS type A sorting domain-containing protein [Ignavibacteriaceae bacterium]|nr:T9SS type A sorting domain-containing protein [Ignavibacteriaceae bacterium]